MPRPRVGELIPCEHYTWMLRTRGDVYFADGRMNTPSTGRHSLGTKDRDAALEALNELDRATALKRGKIVASPPASRTSPSSLPLQNGRELYEKHVRRPRVAKGPKAATATRYKAVFDKLIPFLCERGITDWSQVDRQALEEYGSWLENKGYAAATAYLELTFCKQVIKWLTEENYLRPDRPIQMPLAKAEESPAYCWRPEEFTAIMDQCRTHPRLEWLRVILLGLATTGLRIQELAGLRWCDVNFDTNVITIKDESGTPQRKLRRAARTTKTGRGRTFPLHKALRELLEQLPRAGDGRIFHGANGGRVDDDRVRQALIRRVLKPLAPRFPTTDDIGFADGRLHSFRHFFCSTCANSGVPELVVMRWLGHSSSRMVKRYYHLHDSEAQRQMQRVAFEAGPREASDSPVPEKRGAAAQQD